ncbi:MAG: TIM barrel protein [Negativicutes bacterium]|jgi:sugar phosphate isomerase/epimerase
MSNIFSATMNSLSVTEDITVIQTALTDIELTLPDKKTTNYQEVCDFCKNSRQSLCHLFETINLRPHIHSAIYGNTIDLGSENSEFREFSSRSISENIDFASAINACDLIFHSKYKPDCFPLAQSARATRYLTALEKLLRQAERQKVRLLVENVSDPDPVWLNFLMEKFLSPCFAVCIDIGHINHFGKKNVNEMIAGIGKNIASYHIHDNDGSDDQHQHPQSGTVNWLEFIDSVKNHTPNARLNLELFAPYTPKDKLIHISTLKKWFEVS